MNNDSRRVSLNVAHRLFSFIITKVYVCTNICIDEQYELVREFSGPTWDAFIRRITRYLYFNGFEILEFKNYADYLFNYVQRGKRETEYEQQEISENIS